MNHQKQGNVEVYGNKVIIDGNELPPCPAKGDITAIIDGKVFIDGWEFRRGKWRKTLRDLWHKWF